MTSENDQVLRTALTSMRRTLKANGFRSKGRRFWKAAAENVVALNVQKSNQSSSDNLLVTLNYGVYSNRIGRYFGDGPETATDVDHTHWRKRLHQDGREHWIHVRATDSASEVSHDLVSFAEAIVRELHEHASDAALRDEWLAGGSPGIGSMQRLMFLAILLKEIGPAEQLPRVVAELRTLVANSVHATLIEDRLAMLGV